MMGTSFSVEDLDATGNRTTGVGKTTRFDWKPSHPHIPVTGSFAAHVMSPQWVG